MSLTGIRSGVRGAASYLLPVVAILILFLVADILWPGSPFVGPVQAQGPWNPPPVNPTTWTSFYGPTYDPAVISVATSTVPNWPASQTLYRSFGSSSGWGIRTANGFSAAVSYPDPAWGQLANPVANIRTTPYNSRTEGSFTPGYYTYSGEAFRDYMTKGAAAAWGVASKVPKGSLFALIGSMNDYYRRSMGGLYGTNTNVNN